MNAPDPKLMLIEATRRLVALLAELEAIADWADAILVDLETCWIDREAFARAERNVRLFRQLCFAVASRYRRGGKKIAA